MKKITFLSFLLLASSAFSQINPIDFEVGGNGAIWTFGVFANGDEPPIQVIANPDKSGANTSDTVAQFTGRAAGEEYAGGFTNDIGTFTLSASNKFVRIKVWKPVISDVGIKFEGLNGNLGELKVPNTVINAWEELTFDFSSFVGTPAAVDLIRIVIFPDFAPRTQDHIIYFDDIKFSSTLGMKDFKISNFAVYPNPAKEAWTVKSQNVIITSVQLLDIQGKQIKLLKPNALQLTFDVSTLPQGLYFAKINSDEGVESFKLVKK